LTKKHRDREQNEDTSSSSSFSHNKDPSKSNVFQRTFRSLGPGIITGASDDDPSGIATYSQAGAKFGLGMLWMVIFLYPMMVVIEEICARIGLVTEDFVFFL
jgi:Mn2+/Fe2+ NRAMP family transporter